VPPLQIFYYISTVAILGIGWWKGGPPERAGVIALAIAYLATGLVEEVEFSGLRAGVALVDAVLAGVLVAMSLSHRRWWLLVAAANQFLVVLAHATAVADPSLGLRVSVASRWVFGLIVLYALLGGVGERWLARESGLRRMTSPR